MISAMAVRVTHVVDEGMAEDGVRMLSLLLRRMPADRVVSRVVVMGRQPAVLEIPDRLRVDRLGGRLGGAASASYALGQCLADRPNEVILAWDAEATAIVNRLGTVPVAAVVTDPADAARSGKWWRSAADDRGSVDVICTSKFIERRLVEAGIPAEGVAVVRSAIDLDELRDAANAPQRLDLNLPTDGPVLLTPSPPSRRAGTFNVAWAAAILRQIWPEVRLIVPGVSREQARIRRLKGEIYCPEVYVMTEDRYSPAELLAVSDVLVAPAVNDVPTGWLAWAMVANVPIVTSTVPSAAGLITDGHNGFLCKPGQVDVLARRIRTVMMADDLRKRCAETACSQAHEMFRAERCVDAFLRIIDNLAKGDRAAVGVPDVAITG